MVGYDVTYDYGLFLRGPSHENCPDPAGPAERQTKKAPENRGQGRGIGMEWLKAHYVPALLEMGKAYPRWTWR